MSREYVLAASMRTGAPVHAVETWDDMEATTVCGRRLFWPAIVDIANDYEPDPLDVCGRCAVKSRAEKTRSGS